MLIDEASAISKISVPSFVHDRFNHLLELVFFIRESGFQSDIVDISHTFEVAAEIYPKAESRHWRPEYDDWLNSIEKLLAFDENASDDQRVKQASMESSIAKLNMYAFSLFLELKDEDLELPVRGTSLPFIHQNCVIETAKKCWRISRKRNEIFLDDCHIANYETQRLATIEGCSAAKQHLNIVEYQNTSLRVNAESDYVKKIIQSNHFEEVKGIDEKWRKSIYGAQILLARFYPAFFATLENIQLDIIPIRSEASDRSLSSTNDLIFGAFSASYVGSLEMAEAIVHEYSHNMLNIFMRANQLTVGHDIPQHYSGYRSDPRPISGIIHAVFSFLYVVKLYSHLRSEPRLYKFAQSKYERYLLKLIHCLPALESYPSYTQEGKELAGVLIRQVLTLCDDGALMISPDVIKECDDDFASWCLRQPEFSKKIQYVNTLGLFKKFNLVPRIILNNGDNLLPILSEISISEFSATFQEITSPALVRNCGLIKTEFGKNWALLQKLAKQEFRQIVLREHKGHPDTRSTKISLGDHIEQTDGVGYIGGGSIRSFLMPEDVIADTDFLKKFLLNNDEILIFANKFGTKVNLHHDSGNNIHILLAGKKRFYFLPPTTTNLKEGQEGFNMGFSAINIFLNSNGELKNQCLTVDLVAGDLLYIPEGWWHAIDYVEDSLAVSIFDLFSEYA